MEGAAAAGAVTDGLDSTLTGATGSVFAVTVYPEESGLDSVFPALWTAP